jgi:hypothetical protein
MTSAAAVAVLLSTSPFMGTSGLPHGWEPLSFPKIEKRTSYEWSASSLAIHAEAERSASGLVFRHEGPVAELPVLRWRWMVAGPVPGGDETEKKGDDYAARVYVTFRREGSRFNPFAFVKNFTVKLLTGERPPNEAICYIWANKLDAGRDLPSPYTKKVRMVAVRSGAAGAGDWRNEERNVLEDYRRLFGKEPPPYAGIAIMTDADNTGASAEAWYSDVSLSAK